MKIFFIPVISLPQCGQRISLIAMTSVGWLQTYELLAEHDV